MEGRRRTAGGGWHDGIPTWYSGSKVVPTYHTSNQAFIGPPDVRAARMAALTERSHEPPGYSKSPARPLRRYGEGKCPPGAWIDLCHPQLPTILKRPHPGLRLLTARQLAQPVHDGALEHHAAHRLSVHGAVVLTHP
jgi:hypothetical protein